MTPKEKVVAAVLGLIILGAVAYLMLFAPIGSLGSADGQSYDVDRFAIIGYLLFFLVVGYFVVRSQPTKKADAEVQEVGLDETVWPPAPKRKEPGTGSAGLLLNESVSDTAD